MQNHIYTIKFISFALLFFLLNSCGQYRIRSADLTIKDSKPYYEHKRMKKRAIFKEYKYFLHHGNTMVELEDVKFVNSDNEPLQMYDRGVFSPVLIGTPTASGDVDQWIGVYEYMSTNFKQVKRFQSRSDKKYVLQVHVFCDTFTVNKDDSYSIKQDEMNKFLVFYGDNRLEVITTGTMLGAGIITIYHFFVESLY